ncbi:AbrB/MazE/SpoVT family DNA-binding domain-containing protein [Paucibacter sp. APW11]|uniref:AbrB/MazE/SpoVT family DNA-binding domain-containing protein n=1 Tax=Roseateles aquae TaxID=3077235 RepID=A0ABU3PG74_9BURK|nr:AbrB/MazE/SpoVT family DNA-binding domain-containing protein [Paucibacter sp. APW11]MDT9001592.1 AbrB/MazE/SpoVT family DNA-binding domain-containing protein [Paucibacter sp. APW11]
MSPYFPNFLQVLAKITSKNQLTLPKSVTESLGPVQYFDVQTRAGQIVLTPVRIQRGDAVRAKLAELAIDEKTLEKALSWAKAGTAAKKSSSGKKTPAAAAPKKPAKPLSGARARVAAKSAIDGKTIETVTNGSARRTAGTAKPSSAKKPARPATALKTGRKTAAKPAAKVPAKTVKASAAVVPKLAAKRARGAAKPAARRA